MLAATLAPLALFVVATAATPSGIDANGHSLVSRDWPWPFAKCGPFAAISCSNTTVQNDLCCFNAPGGRLLSTQFWDYHPSTGPSNSWTLHGLWPDHCDGTYDQFCDPSRELTNVTAVLQAAGQTDLLKFMNKYWLDQGGNNEDFWEHEWNKHGTCISTLKPSCFHTKQPTPDVVAFFNRAVDMFKTLPTYDFLAAKGILPSTTKTYTLTQIQKAIQAFTGHNATISCDSGGYFDEVWYHYRVQGSVVDGLFIHSEPDGSKSTCPDTGIKYVPKGFVPPTKTTSVAPSGTATTLPSTTDKATINIVRDNGSQTGCILSYGTWSTQTCATFQAIPAASGDTISLKSSKGLCSVTDGTFACANVTTADAAAQFVQVKNATLTTLTYAGQGTFYADGVPSGTVQETIYTTGTHAEAFTLVWVPK